MLSARPRAARFVSVVCAALLASTLACADTAQASAPNADERRAQAPKPSVTVSPAEVTRGASVRVSGSAPAKSQVVIQAKRVSVEWKYDDFTLFHNQVKYPWKTVAKVRANKSGKWSTSQTPQDPTVYRAKTTAGKSKAVRASVWRWTPLSNRTRTGVFRDMSGGVDIEDYVIGGVTYSNSLRLFNYLDADDGAEWMLGGRCTSLTAGLGIPDDMVDYKFASSRVQFLVNGTLAQTSSAAWAQVSPVTVDLTGAITLEAVADDPEEYYGTYDTAMVNAQVYCKD